MKVQTWVPEKRPIARTLADVPSSKESPVLCWNHSGDDMNYVYVDDGVVFYIRLNKAPDQYVHSKPSDFKLACVNQPPAPKTLDEVPDRWIVRSREVLWFKDSGKWHSLISWRPDSSFEYRPQTWPSEDNWQLTDCIAELVEVEVEVMG